MKISFAAAYLAACVATAASAQTYICDIKSTGDGFMSEVVLFELVDGSGTATVFDQLINWAVGDPIKARVRQMAGGQTELSWNLKLPTKPFQADASYRMLVAQDRKSVVIRGTLRRTDNSPSGNGTCRLAEN